MAAHGTTGEPHDMPDGETFGDGPEIFDDLELAHEGTPSRPGLTSDVTYDLFPLGLPRPTTGKTRTAVTCELCGRKMWCILYSTSAFDRARRRAARIAVGVVGLLVLCWLGVPLGLVLHIEGTKYLAFSAAVATLPLLSIWEWAYQQRDYKKPGHIRRGGGEHSLREPGSTYEYRPPENEPSI